MRPCKLRHFETIHSEHVHKSEEFFKRKLEEFDNQTKSLKKLVSVSSNALLASYKVSYRIAKCKKPHNIGETLVLPAAIDMVEAMFGESYAKQLQQIPLADNTVARRIDDISEDLCDQLVSRLRNCKFAIQVDEGADINKNAHLIAYVRLLKKNGSIVLDFVQTSRRAAQSMSEIIGLQALVKNRAPEIIWTHCMLHRSALVSKNMSPELNDIFAQITKVINYIKHSPLRAKLFAKLCEDMDSKDTSLLYYCEVRWLSRAKVIRRVFELKDQVADFLDENDIEDAKLFGMMTLLSNLPI
ncbi:zinc finger BED domain-containing protein 5-like [Octopus sinensis]|uniref:Zinc finger BED domain-containing protein 5-like n=1 Tax=Octopus sinensis TaxID=2607531 RepID=A0A6P7U180_9MOLL|nr:zinc finger BED domain-containing protein 5-like [Octopus sinensis]